MDRRWLATGFIILLACPSVAQAHSRGAAEAVKAYIRHVVVKASTDRDERVAVAFADLNGDGKPEALVYLSGRDWCGSGGCSFYVLTPIRGGYRSVAETTITNFPIGELATSSHGWRDLSVRIAGGGIRAAQVALRFDGESYPSNPTMHTRRSAIGKLLLTSGTRMASLYP